MDVLPLYGMQEVWGSNPHSSTQVRQIFRNSPEGHFRGVQQQSTAASRNLAETAGSAVPDELVGVSLARRVSGNEVPAAGAGSCASRVAVRRAVGLFLRRGARRLVLELVLVRLRAGRSAAMQVGRTGTGSAQSGAVL